MTDLQPTTNFSRAAQFFRDLAEITARKLRARAGLSDEVATGIGLDIAQDVCEEHAGETLYVPSGLLIRVDKRDLDLHAAYVASGRDIRSAAKQFGITTIHAYRRIKLVEAADYAKRQGSLFEPAD